MAKNQKGLITKLKRIVRFAVRKKAGYYDFNGEIKIQSKTKEEVAKQNQEAFLNEWIIKPFDKLIKKRK